MRIASKIDECAARTAAAVIGNIVLASAALAQGHACPGPVDFATPIFNATGPDASDMALGDLNNDGILDIAVVNAGNGTVSTFLGNGTGTFTPDDNIYTGFDAYAVTIMPVAGLLYGSLVVAHADTSIVRIRRDASGFTTSHVCDEGAFNGGVVTSFAYNVAIAAVVVTVDNATTNDFVYGWSEILGGFDDCDISGSFLESGSAPCAVGFADIDGDDDESNNSIVVVSRDEGVVYVHGIGGSMPSLATFPVGPQPCEMAIGDVNEDGIDDLVIALDGLDALRVLRGDGAGGFLPAINVPYTISSGPGPTGVTLADFNHDGEVDIVLATSGLPSLFFFRGNGNGTFGAAVPLSFQLDHSVGAADVNGDGAVDLISTTPAQIGPADGFKVWLSECTLCPADVNGDGMVTPDDFTAWIAAFTAGDPECDQNGDGSCDASDFTAWTVNFVDGC